MILANKMTLTFAGRDREGDGDPGEATEGH